MTGQEMDVFNLTSGFITSEYVENAQWILKSAGVQKVNRLFPCCEISFPCLVYTLHLARKPGYYIINFVMPLGCLFVSSFLVTLVPADSGEKVSLSVTLLLSSTVYLLVVVDMLPVQSETEPLLG